MLENECRLFMPPSLRDIIEKNFLAFYDQYVNIAQSKFHLDGRSMKVFVLFILIKYQSIAT